MKYLTTIGLEVHVQLKTRSKMFCGCAVEYGAPTNTHTCPDLPRPAGRSARHERPRPRTDDPHGPDAGLRDRAATASSTARIISTRTCPRITRSASTTCPSASAGPCRCTTWPIPKDAQKSIATPDKKVGLVRIHLEEDVAKSFHYESSTGIDFNRAGTPLMEIVTQPEIGSPEEAFAFLTALRQILLYGGVSDADMEKGQMRCDCNVSVRPEGQAEFGAKIEIKNMNTVSGVRKALAYEIVTRQVAELEAGRKLGQETRRWDDAVRARRSSCARRKTRTTTGTFPIPDLMPVKTDGLVATARARMPELPAAKRDAVRGDYGVSAYDAAVLADDQALAAYFETAAATAAKPKTVANWVLNDLLSAVSTAGRGIGDCPLPPAALSELVDLIDAGKISGKQGKEVFAEMFSSGRPAAAIVKEKGMEQLSDTGALEALCDQVIAANPKPVADFKGGNPAPLNFLKGQVMKLSKGQANPVVTSEILQRKLTAV